MVAATTWFYVSWIVGWLLLTPIFVVIGSWLMIAAMERYKPNSLPEG